MIRHCSVFVLLAGCLVSARAWAGNPMSYTANPSTSSMVAGNNSGCNECNECDQCGDKHGRRNGRGNSPDSTNCNCNGSYKFPVPPLYTYHWIGRYSQQLMTDYHSPWRFPPLKPYIEEVPVNSAAVQGRVVPTGAEVADHEPELLSEKIRRHYELR